MNTPFDFWKDHSRTYLEMAFRKDREIHLPDPDGCGRKTGACGDTIEMFCSIRDRRIASVCFRVNGCLNTRACANTVACLAEGRSLEEAWEITPDSVANYLKTLPPGETHCAELAVGALYLALADYHARRSKPSTSPPQQPPGK